MKSPRTRSTMRVISLTVRAPKDTTVLGKRDLRNHYEFTVILSPDSYNLKQLTSTVTMLRSLLKDLEKARRSKVSRGRKLEHGSLVSRSAKNESTTSSSRYAVRSTRR